MIDGKQGDIFEEWNRGVYELLVLFGHSGFTGLNADLSFRSDDSFERARLPSSRRDDLNGIPQELTAGKWLVAICDREMSADGLTDSGAVGLSETTLLVAMGNVYALCREMGATRVLTNGVHDVERHGVNEPERDRRTLFLYALAASAAGIDTTFCSRNDVFVRNAAPNVDH